MQTVILAAGKGTRMRPLTEAVPKPMLPVADRPLCAHAADAAVEAGASELVFVVGYGADTVREYFGDQYRGVEVSYAVQTEQRGTADALLAAVELLSGEFAVLNGDSLYPAAGLRRLFESGPAIATATVEDPTAYGVVSTAAGGRVTEIVEKPDDPPTRLANAGAYVFPASARSWLDVDASERGEFELTDVVARTIEETAMTAVQLSEWLDVGRPWELLAANEQELDALDRRIAGTVADDVTLEGAVVVEQGATVESGVVIEGPVLVREGASVGPNAYVRGATVVGEGCHIGHGVEVKNTVMLPEAAVPHLSYVGDSLIGHGANLGAGTQVANLRHDGATVKQTVAETRRSTGRRKYGAVVGPGVKTGVNTSIAPGVVLGADARTDPGESVCRDRRPDI